MKYMVQMLAFQPTKDGDPIVKRPVEVPDGDLKDADLLTKLGLVYQYGQNDFQPIKDIVSVSAGDVIDLDGDNYLVCGVGFRKLTKEEYDRFVALPRRDRGFDSLGSEPNV